MSHNLASSTSVSLSKETNGKSINTDFAESLVRHYEPEVYQAAHRFFQYEEETSSPRGFQILVDDPPLRGTLNKVINVTSLTAERLESYARRSVIERRSMAIIPDIDLSCIKEKGGKRASKSDILQKRFLAFDFDWKDNGIVLEFRAPRVGEPFADHAKYESDAAATLSLQFFREKNLLDAFIDAFPKASFFVIHSGGGLHVWVKLPERNDIIVNDDYAELYVEFCNLIKDHCGAIADRQFKHPAQCLRMPFSFNLKRCRYMYPLHISWGGDEV